MKSVVVLLSGGIDSAAALWWARRRYRVSAVTFEGPWRPRGERRAARAVAGCAGVPLIEIPAPWVRPRSSGYVPSRNLAFHSVAIAVAEDLGAGAVVAGHNRSDADVFGDARPSFFRDLERLSGEVRILLPLAGLTDTEVVERALRHRVPLGLTWSCYRDGKGPCGRCSACRGRLESFRRIDKKDPA